MGKGYAVVFTDRLRAEFREVALPEPAPDEIVVDVETSWISVGTESSFFRGERIAGERMYREGDPWPFPQVPGYQKVGTVRRVGPKAEGFAVGDRVFVAGSRVSGMFFPNGGHVHPAVASGRQVWKLPDGALPEAFAGLVLTQVGVNCGMRAPAGPGTVAVVLGDGLVGQWTAQTLVHRGARVYVAGRHEERLALLPPEAEAVHTGRETVAARLPAGRAIDLLVDTVGDMAAVEALLPLLRRESHWVSAGFLGDRGRVDIQRLREQEITLHTPSGWTGPRMEATIRGIAEGWLKTLPLVTHRFPADQAKRAWELIAGRREPYLGIVLDWMHLPSADMAAKETMET